MLSLTGSVIAAVWLTLFLLNAALAKKAGEAMPDAAPMVKQILGVEKAHAIPMQCAACAHQFDAPASALLAKQAEDVTKLFSGLGGDVNRMLDEVEKSGAMGMTCPKCGKASAFPMQVCHKCGAKFLPGAQAQPGLGMTCPKCGAESPLIPGDLLKGFGALGAE